MIKASKQARILRNRIEQGDDQNESSQSELDTIQASIIIARYVAYFGEYGMKIV